MWQSCVVSGRSCGLADDGANNEDVFYNVAVLMWTVNKPTYRGFGVCSSLPPFVLMRPMR